MKVSPYTNCCCRWVIFLQVGRCLHRPLLARSRTRVCYLETTMPIQLVPDPTWAGSGTAPLMVKSDAMRKLHAAGKTVSEVAVFFNSTYHQVYKVINPPRKDRTATSSREVKPLTATRLTQMTKKQLIAIATTKVKTESERKRAVAASNELDRRDPSWIDSL